MPDGLYDIEKQKQKDKANRTIDNTLKIEHNQRNKISEGLKGADEGSSRIVLNLDSEGACSPDSQPLTVLSPTSPIPKSSENAF